MPWVKALHIVFIASWFAGLFYLPRIFVNLAMETNAAATTRLLLMARKLYRFMTMLAVPALGFGLWLWLGYRIRKREGNGRLHAKLALVIQLIGYHQPYLVPLLQRSAGRDHACRRDPGRRQAILNFAWSMP